MILSYCHLSFTVVFCKFFHVSCTRSGERRGHKPLLTVRTTVKATWIQYNKSWEVWRVAPSCWKNTRHSIYFNVVFNHHFGEIFDRLEISHCIHSVMLNHILNHQISMCSLLHLFLFIACLSITPIWLNSSAYSACSLFSKSVCMWWLSLYSKIPSLWLP